jgi:hypothetical protein
MMTRERQWGNAHLNIRHRERNNAFTATAWTFHSSQQGVVPSPTTRAPGKWAACSGWRQRGGPRPKG